MSNVSDILRTEARSGESKANTDEPFALSVEAPLEPGDDVDFTLALSGDSGFTANFDFTLTVDGGVEFDDYIISEDRLLAEDK